MLSVIVNSGLVVIIISSFSVVNYKNENFHVNFTSDMHEIVIKIRPICGHIYICEIIVCPVEKNLG